MNQVVLIGRLTRDPEVRYTADQMAITSFTVAIDRPPRQGSKEKQADFPRVTVFGKQAENCERYLAKGRMVAIQGKIQTGSYKNKDGVTVYTTDVVADRVEFLDWGDKGGSGSGGGSAFSDRSAFSERSGGDYDASPVASSAGDLFSDDNAPSGGGMELPEGFSTLDDDDDIPF